MDADIQARGSVQSSSGGRLSNGVHQLPSSGAPPPKPKPPLRAKPAPLGTGVGGKPAVRPKPRAGPTPLGTEQTRKSVTLPSDTNLGPDESALGMAATRQRAHTADNFAAPARPRGAGHGQASPQTRMLQDELSKLESTMRQQEIAKLENEPKQEFEEEILASGEEHPRSSSKVSFRSRCDSTAKMADQSAMDEIRGWFSQLGLDQYADSFIGQGYDDMAMVGMLDDSDLIVCGVHDVAHRRMILHAAAEKTCVDPEEQEWERPSSPQEVEVRIRERMVTSEDVEARVRESLQRNSLSQILEQLCNIGGITPMSIPSPLASETKPDIMSSAPTTQEFPDLTGDADIDLDDLLYDLVKFNPQRAIEESSKSPPDTPDPAVAQAKQPLSPSSQGKGTPSLSSSSSCSQIGAASSSVTSSPAVHTLDRKTSLPVLLRETQNPEDKKLIATMWDSIELASHVPDVKQPTVVHTPAEAQRATLEVQQKIKELRQTLQSEEIWTEEEIEQKLKLEKLRIAAKRIQEANVAQGLIHAYDEDGTERSLVANEKTEAWTAAYQLAMKAELDLQKPWSLLERDDEFNLERTVEDHELVYIISSRWPRTGKRKFIFKIDYKKNDLFENPEAYFPTHIKVAGMYLQRPQERVEKARKTFLKDYFTGTVRIPELETQCYLREKLKSWKKYNCVVRMSGLYYSKSRNKTSDSKNLLCYAKFDTTDIFEATNYKKMFKAPSEHVVAFRSATGVCANGMLKCIAFESRPDLLSWKSAMRCAKYGIKLRENYEAGQRKMMVVSHIYTSQSNVAATGELRSPPLSRGGTIRLIPIVRQDVSDGSNDAIAMATTAAGGDQLDNIAEAQEQTDFGTLAQTNGTLQLADPPTSRAAAAAARRSPEIVRNEDVAVPVPPVLAASVHASVHASQEENVPSNGRGFHDDLPPTQPKLIGARASDALERRESVEEIVAYAETNHPVRHSPRARVALHTQATGGYAGITSSESAATSSQSTMTSSQAPHMPSATSSSSLATAASVGIAMTSSSPTLPGRSSPAATVTHGRRNYTPPAPSPPPTVHDNGQRTHSPDLPPPPPPPSELDAGASEERAQQQPATPPPPPPLVPKKRSSIGGGAVPRPAQHNDRTPPPTRSHTASPHAPPVQQAQEAGAANALAAMSIKQRSQAIANNIGRRPPIPTPGIPPQQQQPEQSTVPPHLPAAAAAATAAVHSQPEPQLHSAAPQPTAATAAAPSQHRWQEQPPPPQPQHRHQRAPMPMPAQAPPPAHRSPPPTHRSPTMMSAHGRSERHPPALPSGHPTMGGVTSSPDPAPRHSMQPPPPATEPPALPQKSHVNAAARNSRGASFSSLPAPPPPAPPAQPLAAGSAMTVPSADRPASQALAAFGPTSALRPHAHVLAPTAPTTLGASAHGYDKPLLTPDGSPKAHMAEKWFHGAVSRTEAESVLRAAGGKNGYYLIRESSMVPGSYVMTMMAQGRIHNFHIEIYSDGHSVAFGIENSPRFPTLSLLIDHFRQNPQRLPCGLSSFVSRA